MMPGTDQISVAAVGRVAATVGTEAAGDARQQDFQRALAGLVGKSMPAAVLSRLSDGSFLVSVAGIAARMVLASQPQPGTEIALTLVSLTPRPTFELSNAPASAAIFALVDTHFQPDAQLYAPSAGITRAGALQRAARLPGEAASANQLAALESPGSQASLSATARILGSVLGAAARSEYPQTSIVAPLPLLAQAPADPVKLAAQLKDAIGTSGLFYESHLAEWSAGKRALAELRREPQMQMQMQMQRGLMAETTAAATDPATAQFINLQLASLEQGRIAWQGQLLPGQDLSWQISRDAPGRNARDDDSTTTAPEPVPAWRSALRLRFAVLGEIGASVLVSGGQVQIALQAGCDEIGALLHAHAGTLRSALAAAGSTLTELSVGALDAPGQPGEPGEPGHD